MQLSEKQAVVLKIGGSVVSDKERKEMAINSERIKRIAAEIECLTDEFRFYLVHGVGNAGHPPVRKYDLHYGLKKKAQLIGFTIAQNRVNVLRNELLKALEAEDVPAIEFYPSSTIVSEDMDIKTFYSEPMKRIAAKGAIPVLSGDLVADRSQGLAVCSGDALVFELARIFDAKVILFGADVDGIYSEPPDQEAARLVETLDVAELEEVLKEAGGSSGIDVSGGMRGKIQMMLRYRSFFEHGGEVRVFNLATPDALQKVLRVPTSARCTRICL